jgi:polar amino acid transport system substrate-binding protein
MCVAGLLLLALASGCGATGSASGTFHPHHAGALTVMTEPLPTVGFWEGTDEHPDGGLEYAMALAIAHRFGLKRLIVRTEPFSKIVTGDLGDADLALALITPTSSREQVLDFTTPYINAAPAFVVRTGTKIPDVQTAQGLRIAVGKSTTFERIVKEVIEPEHEVVRFTTRAPEIAALRDGTVDAAMFDLPAAEAIAHHTPGLSVAAKLSETEPIAAALPSGSPNVEAVGAALRAMEADGDLDELAERWLGTSITGSAEAVPLLRTNEP